MSNAEISIGARWVLPVTQFPIHNAKITIVGNIIRDIAAERRHDAAQDMGEVVLLPQLINAHTHLEFSDLHTPLGQPGISITDWIPKVIEERRVRDHSTSPNSVRLGAQQSHEFGTVAIGEIATRLSDPRDYVNLPLVTCFFERLGSDPSEIRTIIDGAASFLNQIKSWELNPAARLIPGLSPHAPYSVHGALLEQIVELAATRSLPVAMHLAESREELQWLETNRGPFQELLDSLGAWPDSRDRQGYSKPLDYLQTLSRLGRALIIHGNYLNDDELDFIAARRTRMHVVYCPRTHLYFRHDGYPLERMWARNINVAVGTDSCASNPDLNVWRELKSIRQTFPQLNPGQILQMGTVCGALALGIDRLLGSLQPGKMAAFLMLRIPNPCFDPLALLFDTDDEPALL